MPVQGKIVDALLPGGEILEIQTSSLGALVSKIRVLVDSGRKVRIVHPVIGASCIVRIDPEDGRFLSRRKSPKRSTQWGKFDALIHAPSLLAMKGVSLEFPLVEIESWRVRDGSGSWRRKGDRILDRHLVAVLGSELFSSPEDWLSILPQDEEKFSSQTLSGLLGISGDLARKILYTFSGAGFLYPEGKDGRFKVYRRG